MPASTEPALTRPRVSLRAWFVTGLLTLLPIWLTFVVFRFVFGMLSDLSRPWVGPVAAQLALSHPQSLGWLADNWVQTAIALIATVVLILLVGALVRRVAGQRLLSWIESAIRRVPLAKTVYGSARQLLDRMSAPPDSGQRVVLVAFPHPGMKAVGFVTRSFRDEATGTEQASVFVPTTPNPTGGYVVIVPIADLVPTDWTVDEAMTFIISGGAVAPQRVSYTGIATVPDAR